MPVFFLLFSLNVSGAIDAQPLAPDLIGAANENGTVPVIVELKAPAEIAAGATGDQARRRAVMAAQDRFLTRLHGSVAAADKSAAKRSLKRMNFVSQLAFHATAAELNLMAKDPDVLRVNRDFLNQTNLLQSVPLIGAPNLAAAGGDGGDTIIAVLDSGFQADHPFLAGKMAAEACFSTNVALISESLCAGGVSSSTGAGAAVNCDLLAVDVNCMHGTHVAGIALGFNTQSGAGPQEGVAKSASLFGIQVFSNYIADDRLATWDSDIIRGLEHIYGRRNDFPGKRIASVNMSLGNSVRHTQPCINDSRRLIIQMLRQAGIVTVVAAGNNSFPNGMTAPACIPEAVSVASSTKSDAYSSFSNISEQTTVFAPGSQIMSSAPTNLYLWLNGTSMAAPHVAGAIALLADAVPVATPDQIIASLVETGTPVQSPVECCDANGQPFSSITKPRIQLDAALNRLAELASKLTIAPADPIVIERVGHVVSPESFDLTITANMPDVVWQVTDVPSWLQPSSTSGTASQTPSSVSFLVVAPPNQKADLTATLRFSQPRSPKAPIQLPITLKYVPQTLTVTPGETLALINVGGKVATPTSFHLAVAVDIGTGAWTLSDVPSWLKPSATTGLLSQTPTWIDFTLDPTGIQDDRLAELKFSLDGSSQVRTVPVLLDFTAQSLSVKPKGRTLIRWKDGRLTRKKIAIDLATNAGTAKWRVAGLPKWLKASAKSGTVTSSARRITLRVVPPKVQKKMLSAKLRFYLDGNPAVQKTVRIRLKPRPTPSAKAAALITE